MSAVPPGFEAEPQDVAIAVEAEAEEAAAAFPGDPLARYVMLSARQAWYQGVSEGLADARAALAWEMHASGASYGKLAELLGVSRGRAQQLAEKGEMLAARGDFDVLARPR